MKYICLCVCLIFLLSCQEEGDLDPLWYVDSEIIQDAIDCYGKVVILDDFLVNQLVGDTLNFLDKSIPGSLGYSPDSALVPMFFDKNRVLYSVERYKKERGSRTDDFVSYVFWTDLSSFSAKVHYSDAQPNNTKHIRNNVGEDIWVYELYNRQGAFTKLMLNKKSREGLSFLLSLYDDFLIMIFFSTKYRSNSVYLF